MKRLATIVLGISAVLTAVVHLMFEDIDGASSLGMRGIVLFLLIAAGICALLYLKAEKGNRWAYLFLIPFGIAMLSQFLSSTGSTTFISTLICMVSLAGLAFWGSVPPTPLKQLRSFITSQFITETIFPFVRVPEVLRAFSVGSSASRIVLGVVIAIPVLAIFGGLFASADLLFGHAMVTLFTNVSFADFVRDTLRDAILAAFFVGSGWFIVKRTFKGSEASVEPDSRVEITTLNTVFVLVNILFFVFLCFQFRYFFGGADIVLEEGMTYAEYARSGFFQLVKVSALVLAMTYGAYHFTHLKRTLTRVLTMLLVVQTFVVLASALRRLGLYVSAYGLTMSRGWVYISITIIAIALLMLLCGAMFQIKVHQISKGLVALALFGFSLPLLFNLEAHIVRTNFQLFRESGRAVDFRYMTLLSADAIPTLVKEVLEINQDAQLVARDPEVFGELRKDLLQKKTMLEEESTNWLNFNWSNNNARKALQQL